LFELFCNAAAAWVSCCNAAAVAAADCGVFELRDVWGEDIRGDGDLLLFELRLLGAEKLELAADCCACCWAAAAAINKSLSISNPNKLTRQK